MQDLLAGAFAPWVKELNLQVVAQTDTGATFILPKSHALVRGGGPTTATCNFAYPED